MMLDTQLPQVPQPETTLNILFRKFAAHKLDLKEMKAKFKTKKSGEMAMKGLEELEHDAQKLQKLKNQYSFTDSASAKTLAKIFASALESFENKLARFKSGLQS